MQGKGIICVGLEGRNRRRHGLIYCMNRPTVLCLLPFDGESTILFPDKNDKDSTAKEKSSEQEREKIGK